MVNDTSDGKNFAVTLRGSRWLLNGNCPKMRSITPRFRTPAAAPIESHSTPELPSLRRAGQGANVFEDLARNPPELPNKAEPFETRPEGEGQEFRTQARLQCDTCGKTFRSEMNLQMHRFVHKKEKASQDPSECSCCPPDRFQRSTLIRHRIPRRTGGCKLKR
mmetsp:Transcript_3922/g.7515  ORF Transcript_3922/g.7515 Transcript_3922/m.7515 type:complete len:163 (-) Transcript_3922:102-590(-)